MSEASELSSVICAVYDCVIEPAGWTKALETIARYVGGSSALLFHQDFRKRNGNFLQSYNADPDWTRLYFEKYAALNPVMPFMALMDVGSSSAFSRVIDMDEFRASRFYIEWAAPQQFLDVIVTVIDKSATSMGMLGVTRLDHEGLAGSAEIARMELISPHIRKAVVMARLFEGLENRALTMTSAVNALSDAVFLLNGRGQMVFANSAAVALVSSNPHIDIQNESLLINDTEALKRLQDAFKVPEAKNLRPAQLATEFFIGDPSEERLVAHLVPIGGQSVRAKDAEHAVAALFVRPIAVDVPQPMKALARLYKLTARELQLFMGIVQFGGVSEVASNFGIAPTTVRTHLQSVFDKTGVRRQADLAQIAAKAMPPGGPPPD